MVVAMPLRRFGLVPLITIARSHQISVVENTFGLGIPVSWFDVIDRRTVAFINTLVTVSTNTLLLVNQFTDQFGPGVVINALFRFGG